MLKVDLVYDYLEGEPGPNLYFMGNLMDHICFIDNLRRFISNPLKNYKETIVEFVEFVELLDKSYKIQFVINPQGKQLCKIEGDFISISLPIELWREFIHLLEPLTIKKGHVFVEFKNQDLIEDANLIFSSEYL